MCVKDFLLKIPKWVTFSIIWAIVIYAWSKWWIWDEEMTLISTILAASGIGAHAYVKSVYNGKSK